MIFVGSKAQVWLIADAFYLSEVSDIARAYFRHHPSRKYCQVYVFPRHSASCAEEDSCHFIVSRLLDVETCPQYISRHYKIDNHIYRFTPDYE